MPTKGQFKPSIDLEGTYKSNNYGEFKIVEYHGANKVTVEFIGTKGRGITSVSHIKKGYVRDPAAPTLCGMGYTDISTDCVDGVACPAYQAWCSMVQRCYSKHVHKTHPTYKGCTVSGEWLYYSNFKSWYDNNYREGYYLDKDILFQGNTVYSAETCNYVPVKINNLLIRRQGDRGEYPIGVSLLEGMYAASCNDAEKVKVYLGRFSTPEEAFLAYQTFKYSIIKDVATDSFTKGEISEDIYDALLRYRITILD